MTDPRDRIGPPLAPDVGVIGLVPNAWTDLWQPRHHVMRRLAAYFNVAWMDPAPEWREVLGSLRARRDGGVDTSAEGWEVHEAPWYLPHVYRPRALGRLLSGTRLRRAWAHLASRGARELVLYLWRPTFGDALALPHALSVFHIDDEYSFDVRGRRVDEAEVALIRRVDQVIVHSPMLMAVKGRINAHTVQIPNGVDYAAFAEAVPEPDDLRGIRGPRIGYAGWLKLQLDWTLLAEVAGACPDYSFVLVGATKHVEELERDAAYRALRGRANVHFLGRKEPRELAAYAQHFDVCMMPYAMTPYTDRIYPLKLHEYLATGRPVVGTPIHALLDFADVVRLARGAGEWRAALAESLAPGAATDEFVSARRAVARRHDWNILVRRIARVIAERLGHPLAARLGEDSGAPADDEGAQPAAHRAGPT